MGEAKKSLAKRNGNHFRMFVFMGNYVSCVLRVFQFEQHNIFFFDKFCRKFAELLFRMLL